MPRGKNHPGKIQQHASSKRDLKFQRSSHCNKQLKKAQQLTQLHKKRKQSDRKSLLAVNPWEQPKNTESITLQRASTSPVLRISAPKVNVGMLVVCSLLLLAPNVAQACENVEPSGFNYLPNNSLIKQRCLVEQQERVLLEQDCNVFCHLFGSRQQSELEKGCTFAMSHLKIASPSYEFTGHENFMDFSKKFHRKAAMRGAISLILPDQEDTVKQSEFDKISAAIKTIKGVC